VPDALNLLERCLELSPGFHEARRAYAIILQRGERIAEAQVEVDRLLALNPADPGLRDAESLHLRRLRRRQATIPIYKDILARYPRQPKAWMSLGHSLKTVGRAAEGSPPTAAH